MPIINRIAEFHSEITNCRRELHQYPQTAFEEVFASELVQKKLREWDIPFKAGYAGTGIVATIEGRQSKSGKSIGIRADMDALNIKEKSGQKWCSKHEGKMHACGHDGHTSMLLGTAKYLKETRNFDGTAHLIFQPAEENGHNGAGKMIEEGLFKDYPVDYIFGLHNWPALEAGKFDMRVGSQMASMDFFRIKVIGKGGHAAIPDQTIDPIVISNQIISALQTIVSRNVSPIDSAVVSITNFTAGNGEYAIIPPDAEFWGTVRTLCPKIQDFVKQRIHEISSGIATSFGARAEIIEYNKIYSSTINSKDGIEMAAQAARDIVGDDNVDTACVPSLASEDFGAMLLEKPGAYVFLGQGINDDKSPHSYGLHNHKYDFNDAIIPIGVSYFVKIIENYMPMSA